MYCPSQFAENRADVLHAFIDQYPFATLISTDESGLQADSLPLLRNDNVLQGHIARANPLWRNASGSDVLVIFQGPQAYISPSWYPTKHEHGKGVPTWNYMTVHARGRLQIQDDARWMRYFLDRLTARHEAGLAPPWQISDAPADYIENMLKAVVGIEIEISALHGKFKLSQNQPAANQAGVIAGLRAGSNENAKSMAQIMGDAR